MPSQNRRRARAVRGDPGNVKPALRGHVVNVSPCCCNERLLAVGAMNIVPVAVTFDTEATARALESLVQCMRCHKNGPQKRRARCEVLKSLDVSCWSDELCDIAVAFVSTQAGWICRKALDGSIQVCMEPRKYRRLS